MHSVEHVVRCGVHCDTYKGPTNTLFHILMRHKRLSDELARFGFGGWCFCVAGVFVSRCLLCCLNAAGVAGHDLSFGC